MKPNRLRGHEIVYSCGEWIYKDNSEPTALTYETRPCGHCNKHATKEGHDACLGTLPLLINACCGHGDPDEAYVQFFSGIIVSGTKALKIIERLKQVRGLNDE